MMVIMITVMMKQFLNHHHHSNLHELSKECDLSEMSQVKETWGKNTKNIKQNKKNNYEALTSGLNWGRKVLWSSMMMRRHTITFSSLSVSSRRNMSERICLRYTLSCSLLGRRWIISRISLRNCCRHVKTNECSCLPLITIRLFKIIIKTCQARA